MSCLALHIWLSLRFVHLSPSNACACGGSGRRRFPVIASSFTLDSSSLKTEHSSTFYGAIYRRWHSLHCSVLLVRFVTHKFVLQTLPLTVINPQTFSSNSGEEIKRVVKVACVCFRLTSCGSHSPRLSIRATLCPRQFLQRLFFLRLENPSSTNIGAIAISSISYVSLSPTPFFSAVSESTAGENIVGENIVSESSDKNSDPDAATSHAWGAGEAAKDAVASKQRRQQNRLEVVDAFATSLCIRTFSYRPFFLFPVRQSCQKAQTTSSSTLISSLLTGPRPR